MRVLPRRPATMVAASALALLAPAVLPTLPAQDPSPGSDWPGFQGPLGNATSPETGLLKAWDDEGPPVLWKVGLGPGYGGAAVRDGEVFVFDRLPREADVLRVFDLDTGEELWSWRHDVPGSFPYAGSRSVPAVDDDYVFVAGAFGHVHCIDRVPPHAVVWSRHLVDEFKGITPGFGYVQSPLLWGDVVIVTPQAEDAGVVALDRRTGKEVWRSEGLGTSHTTPTVMTLGGVEQIVFLSAKGVPLGGRSMMGGRGSSWRRRGEGGPERGGDGEKKRPEPGERRPPAPPERGAGGEAGKKGKGESPRRRWGGGGSGRNRWPEGEGSIVSLDPKTGEKLWSTDLYFCWQPVCAPLQVDDTRVFCTGGYRSGSLLMDVRKDEQGRWNVRELFRNPRGSHVHLPILVGEHLYLLVNENFNTQSRRQHAEGGLLCLGLDGEEVWRTGDDPFFGRGNVLAADGVLYIQDGHSGVLRVVEPTPEGYRQLAEANVFGTSKSSRRDQKMWAPMALSHGRLLLRSQTEMKCLDLRAGTR